MYNCTRMAFLCLDLVTGKDCCAVSMCERSPLLPTRVIKGEYSVVPAFAALLALDLYLAR